MRFVMILMIFAFTSCSKEKEVFEIGEKIPAYIFKEILNHEQKPFDISKRGKPLIVEFWATWCSPCLPAMKKLEKIQKKYANSIDVITVSSDSKKNLYRYIKSSKTDLRVAYDTTHQNIFKYQFIPQAILIDKHGIVKALMAPEKITDEILADLLNGNDIQNAHIVSNDAVVDDVLNEHYIGIDYQYHLKNGNKDLGFKNQINTDEAGRPVSLEFTNVSIHRLLADIYKLSSVARIYNRDVVSSKKKYCFRLEQKDEYPKELLNHAKEILNNNLEITANMKEIVTDSIYVLKVIDKAKLPSKSIEPYRQVEFRGPYYSGKNISSYNLIEYLENETFRTVKDLSSLKYSFDMKLDWNYENPKSLNIELRKYGLEISKPMKPEKVKLLVLKRKVVNM